MRKILLASTALVALTSVSAMAADVTISGAASLIYKNDDKKEHSDGALGSASSMSSETDVNIKFSATTDSGITTTLNAGFDESNNTDDTTATIGGDFGEIKIVIDGNDDNYVVSMDEAFNKAGEGTGGEDNNLGGTNGESIGYKLPSIVDGLTVAVQHSNEDTSESFGYGVSFDAGIATIAHAAVKSNTATYTSTNLKATVAGISVGVEQNGYETGSTENTSTLYGVSYSMDAITLAYESGSTDNAAGTETNKYSQVAVAYSVAPGISAIVTTSDVDDQTSTNADVEEMEIQLKLSF